MQAVLEKEGQSNRYVNYRGEANNLLSTYIRLTNESTNPDQIWVGVRRALIGLSASPTQDLRKRSPEQVIEAVKLTESSSITQVATNLGSSCSEVTRYRKVVGAILVFLLQREGQLPDFVPTTDQPKYNQLKALYQKTDLIAETLKTDGLRDRMQQMPDIKALLESYGQYSTVELFLRENEVPHTPQQVTQFNKSINYYLFGSEQHIQVRTLLRKATLSRWLYKNTDWYDSSQAEIDERITRDIAFAYSSPMPSDARKNAQARYLRFFWDRILVKEFELAQRDINLGHDYDLDQMFVPVPVNDSNIITFDDIDIAGTFKLFKDVTYCPVVLRSLAREYIEGADSLLSLGHFALHFCKDPGYGLEYRRKWISAGIRFLENALLQRPKELPTWENLTVDRRAELRKLRSVFKTSSGT